MDSPVALAELAELVANRRDTGRPLVVGITGSVAVGKSTLAAKLAERLSGRQPATAVEVVSSDSFLFSNAVLADRGLVMQKGYPASFDLDELGSFLQRVRDGVADVSVPVYDHFTYDIVDGAVQTLSVPDVLIIEGLALLGDPTIADLLDLSIYLDADVSDIEGWYVQRFVQHALRAADEPGGFWDLFAGLDPDQLRASAIFTWTAINLPNLLDHIEPSRAEADVVVTKSADHSITAISRRSPDA